jgi:hypothetical protein
MSRPTSAPEAGFAATPPAPGTTQDTEYRRGGWIEVLRNRRFLLLETTGSLAGAGYAVYSVSVLFLAYGITGNLVVAGAVLFIEYGVYSATFLVAPLVDRARNKRTILLLCYPGQIAAAGALGLALETGTLSVPLLFGLVLVLAVLWDFVWAVFMIAPRLVLEKRQLFLGQGVSGALAVGTQVGGYAGGGALLFLVGPTGGAYAYAVLLLAAAASAIPLSLPADVAPFEPFWASFRRGWDSFRGRVGAPLRRLAALELFHGFFVAVPPLLITAVAYQRFADPSAAYGPLVTLYAVGGSLAGIGLGQLNPRRSVGWLLVITPMVGGLLVGGLASAPGSLVLFGILFAIIGASITIRYSAKYSWVQASFPTGSLGRIVSNLYLFTGLSGTAAVLAVGLLSTSVPLPDLEVLDGTGLVLAGAIALTIPFVRRLSF